MVVVAAVTIAGPVILSVEPSPAAGHDLRGQLLAPAGIGPQHLPLAALGLRLSRRRTGLGLRQAAAPHNPASDYLAARPFEGGALAVQLVVALGEACADRLGHRARRSSRRAADTSTRWI